MTDLKKSGIIGNPLQAEDIRATNLAVRWQNLSIVLQSVVLIGLDTIMLFASWTISDRIGTPVVGIHIADSMIPILAISIGTLAASGFYGTDDKLHRFAKLLKSLTLAQLIVLIAAFFYQPGLWVSRSVFLIAWLLNFLFIGAARFLLDLTILQIRKRNPIFQHPVVLIGDRQDIDNVRKLLERSQQFRIDSVIDLAVWDTQTQLDRIIHHICSRQISEVFICTPDSIDNQIILFWSLKSAGIHLRMVPSEVQLPQRAAETKMIEEIPTSRFKSLPIFGINFWMKRIFDMVASTVISIVISPILLAIAIAIVKTSPGPIFYRQYRVGLKGNRFKVWKFRTMVENASELQKELEAQNEVKGGVLFKIKEDPRITKIGKFLRKYSLDELPQLINVLQGQMSLVGPRPLPIRDYERSLEDIQDFSRNRFLRYEVLPGITGLWQVKGRSSSDSDEIFYWDMVYILQWSLALDLKILLQTINVVLLKKGSY
ncbi:sugar transferase [Chamaesiphon minutus]|uniref:Exopolysaccharide biosynthesis polyprenyl glycosylphosphotransferase n=1 Tax=Chamaesiphon minutus (strain ATCC 27169 / PCC 6605) TaxID=1173020 RepID=K9UI41_CHAP6|nr:sugar transferase [Chamaesiphon minutus]AFY93864.1 exopolysaccharide biosynthesis polyprenyl glycosylphosphotransferase [Chamaesiphon minutus PCC 6605]